MSLPHKKGLEVRIEFCPSCRQAHLVVTHHGQQVQSVALTRSEWAKFIGDYGDILNKMQGGKGVY